MLLQKWSTKAYGGKTFAYASLNGTFWFDFDLEGFYLFLV